MNTVHGRRSWGPSSPQVWDAARRWDLQNGNWSQIALSPDPSSAGSRRDTSVYWEPPQITPIFLTPPNGPVTHTPIRQHHFVYQAQSHDFLGHQQEVPKAQEPEPPPIQQAQYAGRSFGSKDTASPPPVAENTTFSDGKEKKRNYFEVLGVDADCSEQDLKKAYKKLAVKLHPDKNLHDSSAQERFAELSEAFTVLSDPVRRQEYEKEMAGPDAAWGWNAEAAKRNAANYKWSGDEMLFQIGGQLNNARYRARQRKGLLSCFGGCLGD